MINDLLNNVNLIPVQIKNARKLRDSGLLSGNLASIEDTIRFYTNSNLHDAFVYSDDTNQIKSFVVFVKDRSESISALVSVFTIDNTEEFLIKLFDDLLVIGFFKLDLHKISIKCNYDDFSFESALNTNGFIQEAILRDEIVVDGQFLDVGLFSIVRPLYKNYGFAFVPFQRGIVLIGGGIDYIDKVEFYFYESLLEDQFKRDAALYLGICDSNGCLFKRNDNVYAYDVEDIDYLPSEVLRAYSQVKEFLHNIRRSFDLNVIIRNETDFQNRVLDIIKTIPYGSTCSYEDIALKLCDNDSAKARKLTRAVGSACGSNPVPIIIPCHRVIGKNKMLVGFSGGIEFKDFLLQNEMFDYMTPLN